MTGISIIIPTFNYGKYLGECLDSVFASLEGNDEVIVVDDGSTDNTQSLIADYHDTEPRILYLRQPNSGPSAARNTGFAASKGSHVLFLDADDLLGNGQLAVLRKTASEKPDHALYGSWIRFVDQAGERIVLEQHGPPQEPDLLKAWLSGWYISPCALLWPRDIVQRLGGFDIRFLAGEDGEFAKRGLIHGVRFRYCEAPSAWNRKHGPMEVPSLSDDKTLAASRQRLNIFRKIESLMQEQEIAGKYRKELAVAYYGLAYSRAIDQAEFSKECFAEFRRLCPRGRPPGSSLNWLGISIFGLRGKQRLSRALSTLFRSR